MSLSFEHGELYHLGNSYKRKRLYCEPEVMGRHIQRQCYAGYGVLEKIDFTNTMTLYGISLVSCGGCIT